MLNVNIGKPFVADATQILDFHHVHGEENKTSFDRGCVSEPGINLTQEAAPYMYRSLLFSYRIFHILLLKIDLCQPSSQSRNREVDWHRIDNYLLI